MTTTFEQDHPRQDTGRFAVKEQSAPEIEFVGLLEPHSTVTASPAADWYHNEAGELHRTNGPAVDFHDGTVGHYFLNGEEIHLPDDSGYDLASVDSDGTQTWRSFGGNRTATIDSDGTQTYHRDGDLHRDGAPAIIRPDGTTEWYVVGTRIDDPIPAPPTITKDAAAETVTTTGSKYEPGLSAKELTSRLSADIANSSRASVLDTLGIQYAVKSSKLRGEIRPNITVEITGMPRYRVVRDEDDMSKPFHTDEALEIERSIERLAESRNRTTTHTGADYHQTDFWFNVSFITNR